MRSEVSPMSRRHAALTYHDYAALPDDGRRYEIHDGELSVTPAPSPQHQICAANLFRILDSHVRSNGLGVVLFAPLDVILSDSSIVQPDLVYLAPDRLGAVSQRGIEGPPTLAVEIVSPSTTSIDRTTKHHLYARHQVPVFWLVDPDARVIEAYRLEGDRYALALRASGAAPVDPPPFPGLALVPTSLWP
jgi:Uma2 family endonuclease